jgi:hypothetical protein
MNTSSTAKVAADVASIDFADVWRRSRVGDEGEAP